jgi:hypothetical protein
VQSYAADRVAFQFDQLNIPQANSIR